MLQVFPYMLCAHALGVQRLYSYLANLLFIFIFTFTILRIFVIMTMT